MGHHIWSDVVPFVAHRIFTMEHYQRVDAVDPEDLKFIDADLYLEGEWCFDDGVDDEAAQAQAEALDRNNLSRGDWKYDPDDHTKIGRNGRLWGYTWRKGDFTVYLVNESHYSNIGEYYVAVCANDSASIKEFLKDFNINKFIEEMDAVSQSG